MTTCESTAYARGEECSGPAAFWVVYRTGQPPTEYERHPACFRHGLAEVERHHQSAGMAECELEGSR